MVEPSSSSSCSTSSKLDLECHGSYSLCAVVLGSLVPSLPVAARAHTANARRLRGLARGRVQRRRTDPEREAQGHGTEEAAGRNHTVLPLRKGRGRGGSDACLLQEVRRLQVQGVHRELPEGVGDWRGRDPPRVAAPPPMARVETTRVAMTIWRMRLFHASATNKRVPSGETATPCGLLKIASAPVPSANVETICI